MIVSQGRKRYRIDRCKVTSLPLREVPPGFIDHNVLNFS